MEAAEEASTAKEKAGIGLRWFHAIQNAEPKYNRKYVTDSSEMTAVVMVWSTVIVKDAVACSCQEDLE